MPGIAFEAITKRFGPSARPAVDNVTLTVPEGRTCMLVGKSGAGKTTLLRMVNRLIEPTSGSILISGKNVLEENAIALRRHIGYVIQHVGLFPHMNVAENIRITAEVEGGWSRTHLDQRVDELLDLVGLPPDEYRRRFPRELSGGQQQRVGLARALTTDPAILLMDEPFGALDAITRGQMQDELLRIQRDVRKTILFVTHDIEEALKLGDLIAVMHQGKLMQLGAPGDLLTSPADEIVSQLVGSDNVLRELRYLTASSAVDVAYAGLADRGRLSSCSPHASLLDAMMTLLETRASALVLETASGLPARHVTIASIISTLQKGRLRSSEPASARVSVGP